MSKNYYYTVSSLREYSLDADTKGLSFRSLYTQIREEVSEKDARTIDLLLHYYDVLNIVQCRNSGGRFYETGVYTKVQIASLCEAFFSKQSNHSLVEDEYEIPPFIEHVLKTYTDPMYAQESEIDTKVSFETALMNNFFAIATIAKNNFVKQWYLFDQNVRNIAAAYTARAKNIEIESVLVGTNEITELLKTSSAADFGLKGTFEFAEQIMQILETEDMLKKERMLDVMRWNKIDEMIQRDYFNINFLLGYLVKVAIIDRWMALDKETGSEMLKKLIGELTDETLLVEEGV